MPQKLSDDEFVAIWNKHQSARDMANAIGMPERSIYSRRKSLEERGHILPAADGSRGSPSWTSAENLKLVMSSRKDVNRLEITDGVILVGSDAHYSPGHIPVAHKALCNLAVDLKKEIRAIILNGDILDGGQASRHGRIRWKKAPSIKEELEAVKERLGDIEGVRPAGAKLLRTYGNHCARFETRLSNMVPEFEGVAGFTLKDHLPLWEDSERIDINEDCVVIHDWHSGIHSGWNDVLKGGCHTVTGHTHELSAKAHRGFKETHYGIKTGMLADEWQDEFSYRNSKPGFNWQSGFAVLTWVDGMLLQPEFCAVRDDGNAYFRGKRYA